MATITHKFSKNKPHIVKIDGLWVIANDFARKGLSVESELALQAKWQRAFFWCQMNNQ